MEIGEHWRDRGYCEIARNDACDVWELTVGQSVKQFLLLMQVLTAVLPNDVTLCPTVNSDVSKGCNTSIFRDEPKKKELRLLDAEDEISTILRSSVTTNRYGVKLHKTNLQRRGSLPSPQNHAV